MDGQTCEHIYTVFSIFMSFLKEIFTRWWWSNPYRHLHVCAHISALFVFTDTYMLPHTSNTGSLHYAFWCLKRETGWCVTRLQFFLFYGLFCHLNWPCKYIWESERSRERDGVMCLGRFAAHVLNTQYIHMCIHCRALSWTLLFFPLLTAFACSAPACLTCSLGHIYQNAWCCTSLQTASTWLPGLPADCWIGTRIELSSQGVGKLWGSQTMTRGKCLSWDSVFLDNKFGSTCVYIYPAVVLREIWQERDLRSRLVFYFNWMESFSFQRGDRSASSPWLWPEQRFIFEITSFSAACWNRPPSVWTSDII